MLSDAGRAGSDRLLVAAVACALFAPPDAGGKVTLGPVELNTVSPKVLRICRIGFLT